MKDTFDFVDKNVVPNIYTCTGFVNTYFK